MAALSFTIGVEKFNTELLPPNARIPGTTEHKEAVILFLEREFKGFGGQARFMVDEQRIAVSWDAESSRVAPLQEIIHKLHRGHREEAIQLLELLLSHNPDDVNVLYNLGMALSDSGQAPPGEVHLRRALELEPSFTNAGIALGVALVRQAKTKEAIRVLSAAVVVQPNNFFAHLNLGASYMKEGRFSEAAACFHRATALSPENQQAWVALGDSLRQSCLGADAEAAYRAGLALNPHNDLAEIARQGSSKLAQKSFQDEQSNAPRADVVAYCRSALQRFSNMPSSDIKKLSLEIAMVGRNGFDVNSSEPKYHVKGLEGAYTGLQLVSFLYVALKQIAPAEKLGFDLSKEYEAALLLD